MTQPRRKTRLVDFIRTVEPDGTVRQNCAKSTAHKWINEKKLRAYKLGSMTFVDETFEESVERQAAEREEALKKSKTNEPQVGDDREGGREPLPSANTAATAPR